MKIKLNNHRVRRFIETTLPMIIVFGLTIVSVTALFGYIFGFIGIVVFSIVTLPITSKKVK